jgi:hypothetical protein
MDKPIKYSGPKIPKVGDRVKILLNGWENCQGTVENYHFTDTSPNPDVDVWPAQGEVWIGIMVRPDKRPAWHLKSEPTRDVCYFVGQELEILP